LELNRNIHKGLSFLAARIPFLTDRLVSSFDPLCLDDPPWVTLSIPIEKSTLGIVTTARVNYRKQQTFDMVFLRSPSGSCANTPKGKTAQDGAPEMALRSPIRIIRLLLFGYAKFERLRITKYNT
jgi:hypothetical protein